MHLGPDELGEFREVRVTSIHRQCLSVERVFLGQQCTVAIKAVSQKQSLKKIRTGQVLLSTLRMERLRKQHRGIVATFRFEASIRVLHHTTTIQLGYAPIVHLGTVRQSAVIESITFDQDAKVEDQVLRTGSMALVGFRFAYRPEFVTVGRPLVFREGTTKGVGKVTRLF
jgi:GTPase